MLVWSDPLALLHSLALLAPEYPGRKSPCRNAAQAHESWNLDEQQIVEDFITQAFLDSCNPKLDLLSCQCGMLLTIPIHSPPRQLQMASRPGSTLFRVLTASGIASGGGGVFGGYILGWRPSV